MSLIAFTPPSIGPSSYDATEASGRQSDHGTDDPFGATLDQFAHQTARYNAPEESPARGSAPHRPDNHDRFLKRINHKRNREIDDCSSSEKTSEAEEMEVDGELTPDGQKSGTTEVEPPVEPRKRDPQNDPTYASPGPLTLLASISPVTLTEGNSPTQPVTKSDGQNLLDDGGLPVDRQTILGTPPPVLSSEIGNQSEPGDGTRKLAESLVTSRPPSAAGPSASDTQGPEVVPRQTIDDYVAQPATTELRLASFATPLTSSENAPQSGELSPTSNPTEQSLRAQGMHGATVAAEPASVRPIATKIISTAAELASRKAISFNLQEVAGSAESLNIGIALAHPVTDVPPSAAEWRDPDHDRSSGTQDNGQNNDTFIPTVSTFTHSAQSKSQVDPKALRSAHAAHQVVDLTRTAVVLRDRGHGPRLEATLSPPDLGRIRIELQGRGDSLTVRIQVAESQTLQLLQNSLSDLRQQLDSLGLDSDSIAITGWTEHTTHGQPDSRDNTTDRSTRDEAHPMFKSRPVLGVLRKSTQLVDVIL